MDSIGEKRKFHFESALVSRAGNVFAPVGKTSSGVVTFTNSCLFYSTPRSTKGVKVSKAGYESAAAALEAGPLFRFAVHLDAAKFFQSPAALKTEERCPQMDEYERLFALHGKHFLTLPLRGDLTVNAAQRSEYVLVNKRARSITGAKISRIDYARAFDPRSHTPEDIARYKLMFTSPPKKPKTSRDTAYLTKRKVLLETRLAEQLDTLRRLRKHDYNDTSFQLVVRPKEHFSTRRVYSEDGRRELSISIQRDDFSPAQCLRVNKQVRVTAKIFEVFARKTTDEITLINECLTSDNPQAHLTKR